MALFGTIRNVRVVVKRGMGDDTCVKKQDCQICKAFTPAQVQQLATPAYKTRKECREQKRSEDNSSTTPTLVDPSDVTLLGRVSSDKLYSVESTPKQKKCSDAPQDPANVNTAVNRLLIISSPLMTSGVRFFHVWKLCFLTSHLLFW